MSARPNGRIKPLIVPAQTSTATGRPIMRNTVVEKAMKRTMASRVRHSVHVPKVFKNEMDVYAAPITDVIAAHHITMPKSRWPISPAAF